eukprot:CAMPEP_0173434430 /NCGR_PEP_ID=MMETSP1357-20121228/12879_1 /TAXON_ID=77926 /ORGANISM="Hemiselmis rufescens, Strain PCC563" /LENGTH=524 /DNA_ID=CAMNT_0014399285 /DNA_START=19 /DNA_END=1593 /DNA_ORIENTATION=-
MWKKALLGLLLVGSAHAATVQTDITMDSKTIGKFVHDDSVSGLKPAIVIFSETGKVNNFALSQAEAMIGIGARAMVVDTTMLDVSTNTDFATWTMDELSQAVIKAVEATKTCELCKTAVDPNKVAVVGYGQGANAVLSSASKGATYNAGIAYTPILTSMPTSYTLSASTAPRLLIAPAYSSISMLADLEKALGDVVKYEIFMQYDTAAWFNVDTNGNYKRDQAARALVQSASFLSAVFQGTFDVAGTSEPNIEAPLTNIKSEAVTYKDGAEELAGLVVRDSTVDSTHAVVVVPAWKGFEKYATQRLYYLARLGYVAMSANIYDLPIGYSIDDMTLRIANVTQWRVADDNAKGSAFARRIDAARDYAKSIDGITGASVMGFCFGGTGVYNTYRFGSDYSVHASYHGSMMNTRDFSDSTSKDFKGYLAMYSGTKDEGESGDMLITHLKDLSAYNGKWEVTRYSGAVHGFSEWQSGGYDAWAEGRSFQSFNAIMDEKKLSKASGASSLTASTLFGFAAALLALYAAY